MSDTPQAQELRRIANTTWLAYADRTALLAAAAELARLSRERDLFQKKARDWNAEADKYLAQRDELQVELSRLSRVEQALREALLELGDGSPDPCWCGLRVMGKTGHAAFCERIRAAMSASPSSQPKER